jgi:predicted nucleic acid-binding protein
VAIPLLDTSVFLRHVLQDVPDQSARASQLLEDIAAGGRRVRVSETLLVEAVYTLERTYKQARSAIRLALLELMEDANVVFAQKSSWHRILELYENYNVPIGDAQQIELMMQEGLTEIISFDRDFDRIPGITRIEP